MFHLSTAYRVPRVLAGNPKTARLIGPGTGSRSNPKIVTRNGTNGRASAAVPENNIMTYTISIRI
jgi:hypothetical protein